MEIMGSEDAVQRTRTAGDDGEAELAIDGSETQHHTVSVDVLVRAIGSLQQVVYLLAAEEERVSIGQRFALSESFRKRYALRCGVPRESSYALPLLVGPERPLFAPTAHPLNRALDLFVLAAEGAWEQVGKLVPDPKYLPRVLAELQAMLPRPGDGWKIRLDIGERRAVLDSMAYRTLRRFLAPEETQDTVMTVTGELIRIDFASRQIVIRYPPTGRMIVCHCEPAVLETILQDWQRPVQVTGRYFLDRRGHPTRLTDVSRIEPIDLSPMVFDAIEWGDRRLELESPLTLEPTMDDESGQLYRLEDSGLGIDVFAQTREQLADELAEQIVFQWDTYAQEDPKKLTPAARRLRAALSGRLRESHLAKRAEVALRRPSKPRAL